MTFKILFSPVAKYFCKKTSIKKSISHEYLIFLYFSNEISLLQFEMLERFHLTNKCITRCLSLGHVMQNILLFFFAFLFEMQKYFYLNVV